MGGIEKVLPACFSAIGLGIFDSFLRVLDGAVFAMNPDEVPRGRDPLPDELRDLNVVMVAQVGHQLWQLVFVYMLSQRHRCPGYRSSGDHIHGATQCTGA